MAEVPTDLYELLGGQVAWTDQLWGDALGLLLDAISTAEAEQMYELLAQWLHHVKDFQRVYDVRPTPAVTSARGVPYESREKLLEDFRRCKPVVLLETFDRVRLATIFNRPPVPHGDNLGEELHRDWEAYAS